MELSRRFLLLSPLALLRAPQSDFFRDALQRLRWDAAERVPLLVVLPASDHSERTLSPNASLAEVAAAFGYQITRFPTLRALTPSTMRVLTVPKGLLDSAVARGREEVLTRLLATLDSAQWGRVTSEQGLGPSDLRSEQAALLKALTGRIQTVWRTTEGAPTRSAETLTARDRSAIRIRVARVLQLSVPLNAEADESQAGVLLGPDQLQTSVLHVGEGPEAPRFGETVPAKRKRSDLDYRAEAFNALVSLVGVTTVGALLQRITSATKRELIPDTRVASLKIWCAAGERPVRAGELLEALALSVTGTFRKVGSAFVLTDDLVGIGTRLAQWHLYWLSAQALLEREKVSDYAALQGKGTSVGWAEGATLGLSETLLKQGALELAPRSLSPELRSRIENRLEKMTSGTKLSHAPLEVVPSLGLYALVPGRGAALLETIDDINEGKALVGTLTGESQPEAPTLAPDRGPVVWQAGQKERGLLATAHTPEEAKALVALAHRYGFTQLALSAEPTVLGAALAEKAVPVAGLIAPFSTTNPADADRSLLGETSRQVIAGLEQTPLVAREDFPQTVAELRSEGGDWARFDTEERRQALLAAVLARVQVPLLKEVILCDLMPCGYDPDGVWGTPSLAGWLGWTPERRLRFLRKHACDPLDLTPEDLYAVGSFGLENQAVSQDLLPFFPHQTALFEAWKETLANDRTRTLEAIEAALKERGVTSRRLRRVDRFVLLGTAEEASTLRGLASNRKTASVMVDARLRSLEALEKLLGFALQPIAA